MTEQEQIEQLKNWVKQYGLTILAGVVLAFILVSGWRYWQQYQTRILMHASSIYDKMLDTRMLTTAKSAGDPTEQAKQLVNQYPKTPYAPLAAMMLARNAITHQNYAEATKQLAWVINHSNSNALQEIARVRIARIAIAEQQPAKAIEILSTVNDKSFAGLIEEVKGDAYLMLHDSTKARTAYELALTELPKDELTERPLLQMKLDNVTTS
jgi:predicted negative regulator of RcsB-dependent stress response